MFDLPRLAYTLAASLAARAEAKNLVCEIDIADDLPAHVRGDAVRLRSAIENLIANAVKFTAEGRVGLAIAAAPLKRDKVRLTFTVSDSGIGISAAEMKRLFRPFAQANRGIVQKFGGSGLGLVQVRRLAKAMHGDLAVESVPGRGSIFRLAATVDGVPADQTEAPEHDGMVQAIGAPRQLSILCVEDNPYGRVVMNAILTELGHRVAFAGSGTGAIDDGCARGARRRVDRCFAHRPRRLQHRAPHPAPAGRCRPRADHRYLGARHRCRCRACGRDECPRGEADQPAGFGGFPAPGIGGQRGA